jgi:hypothetical protein
MAAQDTFKAWLEREHGRGRHVAHEIGRQGRQPLVETHGLAQFTRRMAFVELTGSVSSWAKGVHDGLSEAGHLEAAAVFASAPPFAAASPTPNDYELLEDHVTTRVQVLRDLLDRTGEPGD